MQDKTFAAADFSPFKALCPPSPGRPTGRSRASREPRGSAHERAGADADCVLRLEIVSPLKRQQPQVAGVTFALHYDTR